MDERQLIVMRHATAEAGTGRDHARALTQRGQDQARNVGESLRSLGPIPDRVLCSTAFRCRETWNAVAAGLGTSPIVEFEDDLYNASPDALLHCLAGVVEGGCVLLLAHNPGVSVLALDLCRGHDESTAQLRAGFAPATLGCFTFVGAWSELSTASVRLTRFERPRSG